VWSDIVDLNPIIIVVDMRIGRRESPDWICSGWESFLNFESNNCEIVNILQIACRT
jgi:hypothetical protein